MMGHDEGPGSTKKWIFWVESNGISFVVGPSPGWLSIGNSSFKAGSWYHVAIRRNGSDLAAFVDGLLIGTAAIGSLEIPDPSAPFQIGTAEGGHPERVFKGLIDDVRIYNRAITDAEVLALYNEGK